MARQKILIVDDEAGMREMLNDLLADMNCDLHFAADGNEGLEKAIEVKPDLMLLDIMLPGMDGFQLCEAIRKRPDIAAVPVIMVTGHNTEESARRGIEVGAEDVLSKPFNMSELKLRARTILQLNRYRILAAERAQFQWVVEHAGAGYVMLDKSDRVTYLNPLAQVFFNLESFSPSKGATLFDLVDGHFERVPDNAWEAWPDLPEKSFLVRPETSQQRALWLQVNTVPDSEDADQRIIRIRDVTEEMMMFQNMWQFEHMVSHKLRTPLTGLIGAVDALEASDKITDEESRSLVSEASNAAQRLHDTIRGVLEHLGSRKQEEGVIEGITLGKLENYLTQLAMTNGIDDIRIEMDPALQMRELKLGSEDALQIIQELYDNSIKFHPERKPSIEVTLTGKDESLATLRVSDDGRTVEPQTLQKIGTPFYQAEKHFTGEIPGMGLGLSMISTLLTTRGGGMRVRNNTSGAGIAIELDIPFLD